ncbi:MAG: VWA domain-containing protein [Candidatus Riflebacteria bacterium]|nr:VWA domain-containing protein [Candidatus Riflebacteria bacterium]
MADNVFDKTVLKLSSISENERKEAVLALFKLNDSRAIDILSKLVDKDTSIEVRYYARKAYYLLRDVHPNNLAEPFLELPEGISFDELERLLQDENPRIRREAVKLAGKLDPGSAAPTIRIVLTNETDSKLQGELLQILGRSGLNYDIPTIAEFLTAKESLLRSAAIEALAKIGNNDALECVLPLLQDPDSAVRAVATKVLPSVGGAEMLEILRSAALSPNVVMREAVINTLQRFKAPHAAKLLAHIATVDTVPALRDKAMAGLEGMARSDKIAREILNQLNTPDEPDDPNAPATVPLDGIWDMSSLGNAVTGAPQKPRVMIVPGLKKKLVREICLGEPTVRENGLRQLASLLTSEHVPFLLLQLDREKDPRILSQILTLIGKTKSEQAYAAVIKRFKDVDNRVRANAIEAAMQIDPVTTPDRIVAFLSDPNNRVRANSIIATATRPNFDPLVWVRDLAGFPDPAYRRSALFVISRLQRANFIPVLEILVQDDELEIRHMAFRAIQEYASRGVSKSRELAEFANKMMGKENKMAGLSDQDFHAAMVAMRTTSPRKRSSRKNSKSTIDEFGEQLFGSDGLKKAGQSVKNLKAQANAARDKVFNRFNETRDKLVAVNWIEKFWWLKPLALLITIIVHFAVAFHYFNLDSENQHIYAGAAGLTLIISVIMSLFRRTGAAVIVALVLLAVPLTVASFLSPDILQQTLPGKMEGHSAPVKKTPQIPQASQTLKIQKTTTSNKVTDTAIPANSTVQAESGPRIKLLQPANGARISSDFLIKAAVKGKTKAVEFIIDDTCKHKIEENREGTFEHTFVFGGDISYGRRSVKVRVTDVTGKCSEDYIVVEFIRPLVKINITSPASGGVFWRDDNFVTTLEGKGYDKVEFFLDEKPYCTFPCESSGKYEYPVLKSALSEGMHAFEVRVPMLDGRLATASAAFRAMEPKPAVRFLSPKNGEDVSGKVEISVEADSGFKETAIRNVVWFADGMQKKNHNASPLNDSWDTVDLTEGTHELKATVENELGSASETTIKVNVVQQILSVSIKGIDSGAVLEKDTPVTVEVKNGNSGAKVEKVVLSLNEAIIHESTDSSFKFNISVSEIPAGQQKLVAEAFLSENQKIRASVSFSVNPLNRSSVFFLSKDVTGKLLTAKDFDRIRLAVKDSGVIVGTYTLQALEDIPMNFGLLIDVSASMKNDQKLVEAREALSSFVDSMKLHDRAFIIKFSDKPEIMEEFTQDHTKLQQEIEYLVPDNGTALLDAVYLASEMGSKASEHTVLIVIADSGDENVASNAPASTRSQSDVLEFASRSNVHVFAVSLGAMSKNSFSEGEKLLRTLCKNTGGRYYSVLNVSELPGFFKSIIQDIRSLIKLSFIAPSTATEGKWRTLEITAPESKDVKFLYKQGYIR